MPSRNLRRRVITVLIVAAVLAGLIFAAHAFDLAGLIVAAHRPPAGLH